MALDEHRRNNFDLVRLTAASQVLWMHATRHLDLGLSQPVAMFDAVLNTIPGVPAFFVVSGFLITDAWQRRPDPFIYARNRILRVYPALWACLLFGIALAVGFGHGPAMLADPRALLLWLAAQLSVLQAWNPDFLRGFGVGVLNGSLWTIPVELQFYLVLPFLLLLPRRLMLLAFVASALCYAVVEGPRPLPLANRVALLSLVPHLFMFGLGVLARLHFRSVLGFVAGRFPAWLALHLAVQLGLAAAGFGDNPWAETFTRPLLAGVVLSAAFSAPDLATRLLRGNDVSYGLYLVHMPVLNAVIAAGGTGRWDIGLAAMAACYALALLSWRLIERPALSLKRRRAPALRPEARPG